VIDVSMNVIDISNIQIHLDISNNERIVSVLPDRLLSSGLESVEKKFTSDSESVSKMIHETTQLLAEMKEVILDISNNPQHILTVKQEFLAVDLKEPLLPPENK